MFVLYKHIIKSYLINISSINIDLYSEKEENDAPEASPLTRVVLNSEGCRAQLGQ